MKKIQRTPRRVLAVLLGLALSVISASAFAEWELNLTEGVTEISREVYGMHMMVLWICVVIGIIVFGAMTWSIIYHRKSKGYKPATFHESIKAEVLWTVAPFIILVAMAMPAAKTLIKMEDASDSDVTIKVTGHQWKWEYEYLNEGIRFFSNLHADSREAAVLGSGIDPETVDNYLLDVDKHIVLPVGKKVRILLTASDVIHAWWVPAFAIKKDAIPGFINEMWTNIDEEGTYRGQCAELCGKDHGFMPIVVDAVSEAEYDKWVVAELVRMEQAASTAPMTMDELQSKGESVYATSCAACHQANGQGIAGVFPSLVDTPIVKGSIEDHIEIVLNGKAGTAMQAFGAQLSAAEIASVITYERNAWGNDMNDMVQPSTVNEMMK
jgi:cytochrome c oxidase subunit 2